VEVKLGVKLSVGNGVSVDGRVGVWVGNVIGVSVAGGEGVNDGSNVAGKFGITLGVSGTIRRSPPHAMRKKVRIAIPIDVFRKRLQWMIQIPENA
jgi:hypothetical protein